MSNQQNERLLYRSPHCIFCGQPSAIHSNYIPPLREEVTGEPSALRFSVPSCATCAIVPQSRTFTSFWEKHEWIYRQNLKKKRPINDEKILELVRNARILLSQLARGVDSVAEPATPRSGIEAFLDDVLTTPRKRH